MTLSSSHAVYLRSTMDTQQIAQDLRIAAKTKRALAPLSTTYQLSDVNDAYAVQQINTQHRVDAGARIIGKKIGLTSLAVQQQLGVGQPDFGVLFHDMEVLNGLSVSMSDLMQPRAEAEVAFVLGEDLDYEHLTIVDIMAAIDYALPAIEIVDSRIADWKIGITDTVADNASASHFVLGHTPRTLDEFDVVGCQMEMVKNGEMMSTGTGGACMGSPLNAVLWLAKKMFEMEVPLEAGEVILSGALGPVVDFGAGDEVVAVIEELGKVSVLVVD